MNEIDVPFIQYLRPHGKRTHVTIKRPAEVAQKARAILEAGYRLEAEVLRTGEVSFTISDDEGDYASELVPNGPDVPAAIDRLILSFDP